MIPEELKAKMDSIEDPELKKIVEDLSNFMFPKFEILQQKLVDEQPGMLKMLKMIKSFSRDLQKEYKEKFGRDFDEDMKKTNEYFGFSQMNLMDAFKNFPL